jgi:hypothetical protein
MNTAGFDFYLEQKVKVAAINFTGIVTMCAIQGDPEDPDTVYYVQGAENSAWYAERLLTEVEE